MAEFSDARSGAYCMCTRERCSDECRTYRQFHPKPITNADRIRSMTDEELARWITDELIEPGYCDDEHTYELWLDWLKEEVADDNNS